VRKRTYATIRLRFAPSIVVNRFPRGERGPDSAFLSWGGMDSNHRPADYEFDPTHLSDQGESVQSRPDQQFRVPGTARRFATLCSPSRDTRGTHLSLVSGQAAWRRCYGFSQWNSAPRLTLRLCGIRRNSDSTGIRPRSDLAGPPDGREKALDPVHGGGVEMPVETAGTFGIRRFPIWGASHNAR
jgi:hypothetical protein